MGRKKGSIKTREQKEKEYKEVLGYLNKGYSIRVNSKLTKVSIATDYDNYIVSVSKSSLEWDWNPNYGVKSPYNRYQVDVFGQLTDEVGE